MKITYKGFEIYPASIEEAKAILGFFGNPRPSITLEIPEKRQYKKKKKFAFPRKVWTKDEDKVIIDNPLLSDKEISNLIPNRTFRAINVRRYKLGISKRNNNKLINYPF